jgi:hypothetical protein
MDQRLVGAATFEGEFSDVTAATPARAWCAMRGDSAARPDGTPPRDQRNGSEFNGVDMSVVE